MELDKMLDFARGYDNLGWAVQEQMDYLLTEDAEFWANLNENAVKAMRDELYGMSSELDAIIDRFLEAS